MALYSAILPSIEISIHALHEESDLAAWGAAHMPEISIHALHEESDALFAGD